MSDVVTVLKMMPEDSSTQLDEDVESVNEDCDAITITDTETEKIAFGLSALLISVKYDDEDIDPDDVTEKFEDLVTVDSVNVETVNKL